MNGVDEFKRAQTRLLRRYGVDAESKFIEIEAVEGHVHVFRYAVLHIVPEAGHVPWFGRPDEVAAATLPFLHKHNY